MRIEAREIQAAIGDAKILHGASIEAGDREFVGVIGPNGSGKSTLLKCIYRILKPSGGTVFLNQKPLDQYTVRESALEMAVVAQHNYYNFDFSVRDVVLMGRSPHKRAMERDNAQDYQIMRDALKKVSMEDFEERSFSTLSGGEQQRIILARALAQKTNCLILDEPTNHLDIKYQLQLLDIVKKLNLTIISAIHDLNIAAMYCDRIFVMKKGQIFASGAPEKILTPELIKEVYEVNAQVYKDEKGYLRINYFPA